MKVNICILKKVILNKIYCLLNDMELIMIKKYFEYIFIGLLL